ncbi:MAG: ABC transporter substrate-binding protein [Clostridiales bacterium]|nr:ABC transporter substrate-binding protein [Clostridiales bacterium]
MRKSIKILGLLLSLMVLFSACGGTTAGGSATTAAATAAAAPESTGAAAASTAAAAEPAAPKTLMVGTIQKTDTFDPTEAVQQMGGKLVYDTILNLNPVTKKLEPCLAKAWEFTDSTTLKLTIRDDVKFSNGEKLTANDVFFSLKRFVGTRFASIFGSIDFEKSTVQDDTTLIIKLTAPDASILTSFTKPQASVLCKSYVESATKEDFWDKPVGTGAYTLVENVSGSHSSYARKEDYWGNKPEAEKITITSYSEPNTMFIDFENGALDFVVSVDSNNITRLQNGEVKNAQFVIGSAGDINSLSMPEYVKYFEDIRVRQAVAYAIDMESVGKVGYGSLYDKAESTLPKGALYYKSQGTYEYNPEKSKELLTQAGYKAGDIKLKLVVMNFPANQKMAEAIQAFLAEVGIEVTVEAYDFATAVPIFMKNGTDLSINGTGGGVLDPNDVYYIFSQTSTNGTVRITDPVFNKYVQDGVSSSDDATRQKNYEDAQKWMFDNVRQVPITNVNGCNAYKDTIKDIPTIDVSNPDFKYLTFK